MFVVTPFLVSGLGNSIFGVWKVLEQFAGYTNVADLRATEVLKWAVAKDREAKSGKVLRQYVTATFILVLLIIPVLLIAGSILIWYSPQITGVESNYADTVRIATAILVISIIIQKVFSLLESILRGMNLGFKRMGFRAVIYMVGGGLQIVAILSGYEIIMLAAIQVLTTLLIGITIYYIVKKNVPWFGWGKIQLKTSLSFFKTSGWFMGWAGVKMILLNSDKVLLGYLAGPVYVTQYVVTEYVMKASHSIINKIIHGVIPGIGKLYGGDDHTRILKVRKHIMAISWILITSFGSTVLLLNEIFISHWIDDDQFAGNLVNLLIVLISAQYVFFMNDSVIINTTLEISEKVYIGFISALLSVVMIFLLVPDYGIVGLCFGILIGRLVLSLGYPILVTFKVGNKLSDISIPYRPLILSLAIWSIFYFFSLKSIYLSIPLLIITAGIVFILLLMSSFYLGLNKKLRMELMGYTKRIKFFKGD